MATASTRIGAEKQAYNANENAWGEHINSGVIDMLDEAWGTAEVTVSANVTLTTSNYLTDDGRHLVLILTGDGGFTVDHPAVDKPYLIYNNCTAANTVKPTGGTGASIAAGQTLWYYTNAAGTVGYFVDPKLNDLTAPDGNVSMGSNKLTNLTNGAAASQDASSVAQVEALIAAGAAANLPVQTGNADKMLSTDGTDAAWYAVRDILFPTDVIGNTGATQTFDLDDGLYFTATVDQNTTFTFSNPATSGTACAFYIEITNGGAFTVTWPGSIAWDAATAPTLQTSGVDIIGFTTNDGGSTYRGFVQWAAA